MTIVEGKGGISAEIVADSVSDSGQRITTFELEYPRFIHSEFMTHRLFSRNAASSRAIPTDKAIELVEKKPAMPIHWGKNMIGMQAQEEHSSLVKMPLPSSIMAPASYEFVDPATRWKDAAKFASGFAKEFGRSGYHKQIVNRIIEPFQFIKVVCTATEYDNFFYLRDHKDAQPEIRELARCMKKAREDHHPQKLDVNEWHLPYITYTSFGYGIPSDENDNDVIPVNEEDAIKISASCCAQVSYRKNDTSVEKALKIYDMLVNMKPVHASPFEHQATPISVFENSLDWDVDYTHPIGTPPSGITHYDRYGYAWSGNFKGFTQYRQLIKDHVYTGKPNHA